MTAGPIVAALILCLLAAGCAPAETEDVARGRELFAELGCAACHATSGATDGPRAGPSLAGLYGTEVRLADDRTVTADEGYLREAIIDPDATTVAGFPGGVMASGLGAARTRLDDAGIVDALVSYIASLK